MASLLGTVWPMCLQSRDLRRQTVEVDPLDAGPGYVLGAFMAVDEDPHAEIRLAEVAGALLLPGVPAADPSSAGVRSSLVPHGRRGSPTC